MTLRDIISKVEKNSNFHITNIIVLDGIVIGKMDLNKTRNGNPKFKFVLGFENNKAIICSTRNDLAISSYENLKEMDRVRVIGKFHTASWEEDGEIKDAFEIRVEEIERYQR